MFEGMYSFMGDSRVQKLPWQGLGFRVLLLLLGFAVGLQKEKLRLNLSPKQF